MKKIKKIVFFSVLTGIAGAQIACQEDKQTKAAESNAPIVNETSSETKAVQPSLSSYDEEYSALPDQIILEVPLTSEGQLELSQAELKGHDDLGSSTASWNQIPRTRDALTGYDPVRKSALNPDGYYRYQPVESYERDGKYTTVYKKPSCQPQQCFTQYTEYQSQVFGNSGSYGPEVYVPLLEDQGYLDSRVWQYLKKFGVAPLKPQDYLSGTKAMYNLGERLFYDKLLSSNRDVACASCHLESKGTSNGYSIGPSGQVLGGRKTKNLSIEDLLPRNAPHLFNVGHRSQRSMFWDGRVEVSVHAQSGFNTPAGDDLPLGLNSALAAQSLFPLVNPKEMGCGLGESQQSLDPKEQWQKVMDKVLARPDYKLMFAEAFPDVGDWGIEHLANAIAVFESSKWRSWNSRFDQFLTGNSQALSEQEKQGALYFYGKGDCARCHSGPLLSDLKYHGIALPQFGPGMGDHPANQGDQGRARVTESEVDRYRFKTPSLRNVTMTGPWGHNGAFSDLKRFISHYRNPNESLRSWSLSDVILAPQFRPEAITQDLMGAMKYPETIATLMQASEVKGVPLTDQEMHLILQFLGTLSDYSQKQSY